MNWTQRTARGAEEVRTNVDLHLDSAHVSMSGSSCSEVIVVCALGRVSDVMQILTMGLWVCFEQRSKRFGLVARHLHMCFQARKQHVQSNEPQLAPCPTHQTWID